VGDLGIGFEFPYNHQEEHRTHAQMNEWFGQRNIKFYSIRGNHDDPQFFTGDTRVVYDNFELLEDYSLKEICGKRFLFIGGAISVDRKATDPHNRPYRRQGFTYWADEILVLKKELLQPCDVLITHTAPTWVGPLNKDGIRRIVNFDVVDPTLWDDCMAERKIMDEIIRELRPAHHYCGHFHEYAWADNYECLSTILNIMQFKEHIIDT
jgi:hypothetical protein